MRKTYLLGILFILFFLFSITVMAQKTVTPSPVRERLQLEKAELERPVTKGLIIEKKLSSRLPNGYRNIVTEKQRNDIYALQKDYAEIIELLKIRITLLERECDQQVDALLTSDQVSKIRQTNGILESEKHLLKKDTPPKRKTKSEEQSNPKNKNSQ